MNRTYKEFFYLLLIIMFALGCSPKVNHLANVKDKSYRLDEKFGEKDQSIEEIISPYRTELDKTMNVVIAQSAEVINKAKPNSPLLNFMADVLLTGARKVYDGNIDLAVQNYGGIRVNSLPAGDITVGNVYELMPFDNTLVILEVQAAVVKEMLDRMADYGGWPISEGTSFRIVDEKYADDIIINNKPFDINATYTLALPDYIANGGDKVDNFKGAKRTDTGILIRDLIIDQLKESGILNINHEIRIK